MFSAGILFFGAVVYVMYGSSELQPWATKPPTHDAKYEESIKKTNGVWFSICFFDFESDRGSQNVMGYLQSNKLFTCAEYHFENYWFLSIRKIPIFSKIFWWDGGNSNFCFGSIKNLCNAF